MLRPLAYLTSLSQHGRRRAIARYVTRLITWRLGPSVNVTKPGNPFMKFGDMEVSVVVAAANATSIFLTGSGRRARVIVCALTPAHPCLLSTSCSAPLSPPVSSAGCVQSRGACLLPSTVVSHGAEARGDSQRDVCNAEVRLLAAQDRTVSTDIVSGPGFESIASWSLISHLKEVYLIIHLDFVPFLHDIVVEMLPY